MSRIAAIRAAAAGVHAPVDVDEDTDESPETSDEGEGDQPATKSKKKEPVMADENTNAAVDTAKKEGHTAGFKAANDRMNAVMASEHYAGREASAAKMLSKEALGSDDIIDLLAVMPKTEPTGQIDDQQRAAAEEGGRNEMLAALGKDKNSSIDADGGKGGGKDKAASSAAIWDQAIAAVCPAVRK